MKKIIFTLLLLLSCYHWLAAQCPTGDITFSTQGQVDSFQINYPGCTDIPGNVTIKGSGIQNLNGLIGIASVGGDLTIGSIITPNGPALTNDSLSNLFGLDSLHTVDESLKIHGNKSLVNVNGLKMLGSIGGDLSIIRNNSLVSVSSLENLTSISGSIIIGTYAGGGIPRGNPLLKSLSGLERITAVGGSIKIVVNNSLASLEALENIDSIPGNLVIDSNHSLSSLSGLENVLSIGGSMSIDDNGVLTSLSGLQNLQSVVDLGISANPALVSLSGLENLQSVVNVGIGSNSILTSLKGLENIDSIGSLIIAGNDSLKNFAGLENLHSIGYLDIRDNDALTSLGGLENLQSLVTLYIQGNDSLASLTGLENVDSTNIFDLTIKDNLRLTVCNVQPICKYLENGGPATISNNAPGCNSIPEVEAACMVSIEETSDGEPAILFSPNPAGNSLQIQISDHEKWDISLHALQGGLLYRQSVSGNQTIEVGGWPSGLYVLRAVSGERVYAGRFVKE